MSITIQLPDGTNADFETDDPKAAAAAARKVWANKQSTQPRKAAGSPAPKPAPKAAPKSFLRSVGDAVNNTADWITMGLNDEVAGAVGVVGNAAGALSQGISKDTLAQAGNVSEAYNQSRKAYLDDQKDLRENHGNLAMASNAAGLGLSLASGGLLAKGVRKGGAALVARSAPGTATRTAGKVINKLGRLGTASKGAGFGGRAVAGLKGGAATGAIAGAANSDGVQGRINGAVGGAVLGAGVGAAAPAAIEGVKNIGGYVGQIISSAARDRAGMKAAYNKLASDFQAAGITPDQAITEIQRRSDDLGVPTFLADLHDSFRATAGAMAKALGPARTAARAAIEKRQAGAADRIQGHIADDLGAPVNVPQHTQTLRQEAKNAGAAYDESNAQVVNVDKELADLMAHPDIASALKEGGKRVVSADLTAGKVPARKILMTKGQRYKAPVEATPDKQIPTGLLDASGKPIMRTKPGRAAQPGRMKKGLVPKMEVFDQAKTVLSERAKYGGGITSTEATRGATRSSRIQEGAFLKKLDAANPKYPEAREAFKVPTRERKAFIEGNKQGMNMTADEIKDVTSKMSAGEAEQFMKGITAKMSREVSKKGGAADQGAAIIGTPEKRARLAAVASKGTESRDVNKLADRLEAEKDNFSTYKKVFLGPQTANDAAEAAQNIGPDLGRAALAGGVLNAKGMALNAVAKIVESRLNPAIGKVYKAKLQKALVNEDIDEVKKVLGQMKLSKEEQSQFLRKLNGRQGYKAAAGSRLLAPTQGSNPDGKPEDYDKE